MSIINIKKDMGKKDTRREQLLCACVCIHLWLLDLLSYGIVVAVAVTISFSMNVFIGARDIIIGTFLDFQR